MPSLYSQLILNVIFLKFTVIELAFLLAIVGPITTIIAIIIVIIVISLIVFIK
jgi:hypothetical protein